MRTRTRKRFRALLLACGTCLASPAVAETNLSFGTLMSEIDGFSSPRYGLAAQQVVGTMNAAGSAAVRYGHEALSLDEAGPLARGLYTLTAYQALVRFHWANSIYFGHEGSHFATAHQFGLDEHYFRDDESGERLSNFDAYRNIFLNMEVGGPAVSSGSILHEQDENYRKAGIMATTSGVNWQIDYSERWLREALAFGGKDAFDAPEFVMNRLYFTSYALGDILRKDSGDTTGDFQKWARHMEEKGHSGSDTLEKAAALSFASNLLSPQLWSAAHSVGKYIVNGETRGYVGTSTGSDSSFTWDVPHFLNASSMTLAPTAYWSPGLQDDRYRLSLGAGLEVPAFGEADPELRLSATGRWDQLSYDTTLALGQDGAYSEASMNYHLTDGLALNLGAAIGRGETLQQSRDMPAADAATWAGIQFNF